MSADDGDYIDHRPISEEDKRMQQHLALFIGGIAHDYQFFMERRPATYGIPVGIYGGTHSYSRVGDTNLYLFMGVE